MRRFRSFGGLEATAACVEVVDRGRALPRAPTPLLARGRGLSYGDVGLLDGGCVLDTSRMDRMLSFDAELGVLRAEAGARLADVLDVVVPRGWFLPVVPGTAGVTLGGALANDVHGKNHHVAGTFAHHVRELELVRSDGSTRRCGPALDPDWFAATAGGAGLTGLIAWVELSLRRVAGTDVEALEQRFDSWHGYLELADRYDREYEYTVAWIDGLARGRDFGRGVFGAGRHAEGSTARAPGRALSVPVTPPWSLVRRIGVRAFNELRWRRASPAPRASRQHYEAFLFPLDHVAHWNRLYGRRGFLQYQCVVPDADRAARILETAARGASGPMLTVAKRFGALPSLGMLSFARPGITLAMDFAHRGSATLALLDALDEQVAAAGGAVYLAKDARQSRALFAQAFPRRTGFEAYRDPAFDSNLWRRVA